MKSRFLHRIALLLLFIAYSNNLWADWGTKYYYVKATANVLPTGSGTVYAEKNTSNGANGTQGNTSTATAVTTSQGGTVSFTFQAEPSENYDFKGWSTTNNVNATGLDTNNPTTKSYTAPNNDGENNASQNNIYAIFAAKPLFYFRAAVVVSPSGAGTVTIDPVNTSSRGDKWNSTSATATSQYTATTNSNYHFMGWSTTEDGDIVSSDLTYVAPLTSTSTSSNNPTVTTYYARFQPYPTSITASPSTITLGAGDSSDPISVTVIPANAYTNIKFASDNTSIATVDENSGVVTAGNGANDIIIHVNAMKDDGITVAATCTVNVIVKNKCIAPAFEVEPNADGNTATVTITTSTQEPVSIYYTLNGNDPTTASTLYTGPFTVNNGQTIKAFAVKTDYYDSNVSTVTFTAVKVATPTITMDQSGVSFSCATNGASFYYTTDGSTPTTSSSLWNGSPITNLSDGTTIKVIAAKTGMIDSDPAVETYHTPTGVSGSVVTLNDLEKHDWSYYDDPDCPIRSLDPADVKITYLGNGIMMKTDANYAANTNANDIITSNDTDWKGSVAVGITNAENQNTIVYLKTLERAANTDSRWTFSSDNQSTASARCAYTTIPNPFQKRPTYTDSGNARWRGFQCWRLKSVSNGKVFSASSGGNALATNTIINAETEIYFAPDGEYNMEVVFEAVGARAYVSSTLTTSGGQGNNQQNYYTVSNQNVGYERNFVVITDANTYNIGSSGNRTIRNDNSRAFTITAYYPDGTVGNANATFMSADNSLTADTKIENIKLGGSSNTLCAAGHNLIIGRGVTGTVNYIQGINTATNPLNFKIRLESGTYKYIAYLSGYQQTDGNSSSTSITCSGTENYVEGVLGCDYDRASGNNDKLENTGTINMGVAVTLSNQDVTKKTFDLTVKSGKFLTYLGNNMGKGGAEESIYMAIANIQNSKAGGRKITIQGGEMASIAGGIDAGNQTANNNVQGLTIRMTGGTVKGAIYGGAATSPASGNRTLIITGGTVNGWIGAGCNGVTGDNITKGGQTYGKSSVYVGGNVSVGGSSDINGSAGGTVFAAGKGSGASDDTESGMMAYGTTIAIADNCDILNNVYGGGNYGFAEQSTNMYIAGGKIHGRVFGGSNQNKGPVVNITIKGGTIDGGVYGGSNASGTVAGPLTMNITGGTITQGVYGGGFGTNSNSCDITQTVDITMTGGTVLGGLYGGGNVNSKINGKTTVNINGGTIGASATNANVYGGGLGALTRAKGDVEVSIGSIDNQGQTSGDAVIYGDVYGGSAKGVTNCNDGGTARNGNTTTKVTLNSGTIHGSLYGGGHGIDDAVANVWGPVTVVVNGGSVIKPLGNPGSIFGCNNEAGSPKNTVTVTVNKTNATVTTDGVKSYAINGVYGGGNLAHYDPSTTGNYPTVTINGCNSSIRDVYGGGNAAAVPYTNVTINGGDIYRVFAGGNGESGTANVGYKSNTTTNSYGAGTAEAHIYGGTIYQVFGGSNTNGVIREGSSIEIDKSQATGTDDCDMIIQEVYGGGNKANGNASSITIGCTGALETGENGHAANPGNIGKTLEGIGSVYGGANQASIGTEQNHSDITLNINSGMIANVFGGNNTSGTVYGDIVVNINKNNNNCGWYVGNVFGGGNNAPYPGDPEVNIINGTISLDVFGGGKGPGATVTGNPVVTVGSSGKTVIVNGNVYGGGDAAPVTGNTQVAIGNSSTVRTKVFGGGNQAGVSGNATVQLTSGTVGNTDVTDATGGIYGGCNSSGTIGGNSSVTVLAGTVGTETKHANIHGGGYGNLTGVAGNVTVNIGQSGSTAGATIYGDVYGGSALGTVNTTHTENAEGAYNKTTVNLYGGLIDGNVYGGGLGDDNTEAIVYGDVDVFQYGAALKAAYSQSLPSSGMIFGCNNVNGTPKGHVKVVVYKTTGISGVQERSSDADRNTDDENDHTYELAAVFGGGNHAAYVPDDLANESTEVFINGCGDVSIHSVYGGGNAASTPATDVTVEGAYEIEYVFGGGNGAGTGNPGANVGYYAYPDNISGPDQIAARAGYIYGSGVAKTSIFGGRLHKVFGGSNTKGNVRETTVAMLDEESSCNLVLDGFYGGGKSAYMEGKTDIQLGCISGLHEIYGGAENADVGSNIVLTLTSGKYNKVYGGNNIGGKIRGSITINIEQTGCLPIEIGELFLGGNNAPYSVYGYNANGNIIESGERKYADPVINIRSCKSIGTVFGGGEGAGATLAGNPTINANIASGWVDGQYRGHGDNDPYGIYHAAPQLLDDGVIDTIFGGGKKAKVIGYTTINVANQENVEMVSLNAIKAKIQASQTGKFTIGGMVFELADNGESIQYTVLGQNTPALTRTIIQPVNGATVTGNIYGGGNEADVTGQTFINVGLED